MNNKFARFELLDESYEEEEKKHQRSNYCCQFWQHTRIQHWKKSIKFTMNNNVMVSRQSSNSSSSHHHRPNGVHHSNGNIHKSDSLNPSIWTTNTSRSSSKSNFTSGSNDFHFIQASDINTTKSGDVQNGSTAKLLPYGDDQSNNQVSVKMIKHQRDWSNYVQNT